MVSLVGFGQAVDSPRALADVKFDVARPDWSMHAK